MEKININEIEASYNNDLELLGRMLHNVVYTVNECIDKINELDSSLLELHKNTDVDAKQMLKSVSEQFLNMSKQ